MADDPWMKKCCYCGKQPVEWNHALFYRNRQIQEVYSIVPLCLEHHRGDNGTIPKDARDWSELVAIARGREDLIKKYPKFDWKQRKKYLEQKLLV